MTAAILDFIRVAGFPLVFLGAIAVLSFGFSGGAQPDQEN